MSAKRKSSTVIQHHKVSGHREGGLDGFESLTFCFEFFMILCYVPNFSHAMLQKSAGDVTKRLSLFCNIPEKNTKNVRKMVHISWIPTNGIIRSPEC